MKLDQKFLKVPGFPARTNGLGRRLGKPSYVEKTIVDQLL
jgi:hypothetical protein